MSQAVKEQTQPYDFGADPVRVNIHLPNDPRPNKFTHRLRKPTLEQWLVWGHELYEERRNLSPEEIEEGNKLRDADDLVSWAYEKKFNEYDPSRRLYEAIAIDVTDYKLDESGELQPAETHPLTPKLLNRAILNKDVVISSLYKSYCELEESSGAEDTEEVRVRQTIGVSETPPSVLHALRKATDEERQKFQNESLRTYAVADNPDTIRICVNLRIADDLYNEMLLRVENATVNGQSFDEASHVTFLKEINPVFKFKVLEAALQIKLMNFDHDLR
jgi:hypothetical protein